MSKALRRAQNRPAAGKTDFWPSSSIPNGALVRDGSEISRDDYAELFNVIGTTYGSGDGSTTFNLPDDRGEFIRGSDEGRGTGAGTVGDTQGNDAGYIAWRVKGDDGDNSAGNFASIRELWISSSSTGAPLSDWSATQFTDIEGDDTHPRNRAYLPIIWY